MSGEKPPRCAGQDEIFRDQAEKLSSKLQAKIYIRN